MRQAASIELRRSYSGTRSVCSWEGLEVADAERARAWVAGPVAARVRDAMQRSEIETHLRALTDRGVVSSYLRELLLSSDAPEPAWRVGEALAEVLLLGLDARIDLPWPSRRDRRAPGARTHGPDIVGFVRVGDSHELLVGEVKTSAEHRVPPSVMRGSSGLCDQVIDAATMDASAMWMLLAWLRVRCDGALATAWSDAVKRIVRSGGRRLHVVGVLVRDTAPNPADLASTVRRVAVETSEPCCVRLLACYLPFPLTELPALTTRSP